MPDSHSNGPSGQPSRRPWLWIIGALAVAAAAVWWFAASRPSHAPAAAPPASSNGVFRPTELQLKQLQIEPAVTRAFTTRQHTEGRIAMNADHTTAVFSPFSGNVERIIAKPGDVVRKGDPLLAISASELVQAHDDLVAAYAGLEGAQAQLKQAELTAKRKRELFDIQAGSMQDAQQAQADLAAAQAAAGTARAALGTARGKLRILGRSDADIDKLQTSAHIGIEAMIRSPIGGVVVDRQVGLGQYLQADPGNRLFTISDLSTVWLEASVREADAGLVKPGAQMRVSVAAYPGRVFEARVTYVAATVDPETRRIAVRAEMRNADGALKPEMFASFAIEDGPAAQSVAVPEYAVLYEGPATRVWVADAGNALSLRSIRVGRGSEGMLEVLDGLAAGERVVTRGSIFIDRAAQQD